MERYTGQAVNYPYTISIKRSYKKDDPKKRIFCEDIFTFDIETTSYFYEDDHVPFMYYPGKEIKYWNEGCHPGALPYLWQFGINGKYYYGREIKTFKKALSDLPPDMKVIIWVHNLSWEWHFLEFLHWDYIFARSSHNPIACRCKEFPNITFRCTYALENMSLENWGKELGIPKLVGDLDYNKMRTPLTDLTDAELKYGERDLEVVYAGICRELTEYKTVHNIPLTSTGKVRRIIKENLMSDNDYVNYVHELVPNSIYQYETSRAIYAGGYTHGNRTKVGVTFINKDHKHGGHYDFTSSYPYEMVTAKVPCSQWAWCKHEMPDESTFEDYAYKMHLKFYDIKCETQNTYIQCAKCAMVKEKRDNGRLLYAKECTLWCTEQDFEIIKATYTWKGEPEVLACWRSKKDYLPLKFVQYVLELFEAKTKYKHVDDIMYAWSKARLNSLYGLCVTAICQEEVIWNDKKKEWKCKGLEPKEVNEHFEKLRRFKDHRYFLNYDWGCWISNGSRVRLWKEIIKYDEHVIYADTDSLFTDISIDFTDYNNMVDDRLKKVCEERGLDFSKTRPVSKDGDVSCLGHFTSEPEWTEFKCLRAKCYCERWAEDGKLHLTVSGVNKGAVTCLKDDLDNFKDGVEFDRDEEDVDKLLHTYLENMPQITFPDGYVSKQKRGVNLRPNGYKVKIDADFKEFIEDNVKYQDERYNIYLRGIIGK